MLFSVNESKEEIIAEDYDEEPYNNHYDFEYVKKPEENLWKERMKKRMVEGPATGYKCCPNKSNIFHKCTLACANRWGDGILQPSEEYMKRKSRLLKRYPLPNQWVELYDFGCGVYYFWNKMDDTVSWLPPTHPKAIISKCASVLRKELDEASPPEGIDLDAPPLPYNTLEMELEVRSAPPPEEEPRPPPPKKTKSRDLEKAIRSKYNRRPRRDLESEKLDPMDPAAYSDIPRGSWSAGLNPLEKQTGVDTTASGVLFQMRPYPSPGAILQANKGGRNSESSGGEENENSD